MIKHLTTIFPVIFKKKYHGRPAGNLAFIPTYCVGVNVYLGIRIYTFLCQCRDPMSIYISMSFYMSIPQCCGSVTIHFGSGSDLGKVSDSDLDPYSDLDP
jgi:hypothetical protein